MNRLISLVKKELDIDNMLKLPINPENLLHIKTGGNLLETLSTKIGQSLKILAPPVIKCLMCEEPLGVSNEPVQIAFHKQTGPEIYSKYILRCQNCRLVKKSKFKKRDEENRQTIYYHPDKYGNMTSGYMFYRQEVDCVKASNEVYLEAAFLNSCLSNFMHGFMSMESTAEAYNESFRSTQTVRLFKEFLEGNKKVGQHFNAKTKAHDKNEDLFLPGNHNFNQKRVEDSGLQIQNSMHELHRKSVVNAYYNFWVKQELKERSWNHIFGPYKSADGSIITFHESVEAFLVEIDDLRSKEIYAHDNCAGKFCLIILIIVTPNASPNDVMLALLRIILLPPTTHPP